MIAAAKLYPNGLRYPAGALVLAIDPGQERTGIVVREVASGALLWRDTVRITAAGFSQADAIAVLEHQALDRFGAWMAAVERTFTPTARLVAGRARRGKGTPPSYAEKYWLEVVDLFARSRCKRVGRVYHKPQIVRPRATDWRSALGIRTHSELPRTATMDERRADLKQAAREYLRLVEREAIEDTDQAEAACIATWGVRLARIGCVPRGARLVDLRWAA